MYILHDIIIKVHIIQLLMSTSKVVYTTFKDASFIYMSFVLSLVYRLQFDIFGVIPCKQCWIQFPVKLASSWALSGADGEEPPQPDVRLSIVVETPGSGLVVTVSRARQFSRKDEQDCLLRALYINNMYMPRITTLIITEPMQK